MCKLRLEETPKVTKQVRAAGLRVWKPRLHTRRSSNSAPGRGDPAASGAGRQGAAPGFPRPPGATWRRRSPPPEGCLPPSQIPQNARQGSRKRPRALPRPTLHPGAPGAPGRAPRRAPPAGQVLRDPLTASAPPVSRRREAGRPGQRGADEGAASPPSSTGTAGLRAAGAPAHTPAPGGAGLRALTPSRTRRCGPRARPPGSSSSRSASSPRRRLPHLRRDPQPSSGRRPPRRPGGSSLARALSSPTSLRLAAPAPRSPAHARRSSSLPSPSSSPHPRGSLPTLPPARLEGGSAPSCPGWAAGSSEPPPPPFAAAPGPGVGRR